MAAPRHSIARKVLAVKFATTLVALLLAITAMVAYDLRLYHQSWINDLNTQAELLGQMTASALSFDDAKVARENLALLRYRPSILAAAIYDARGRLFATYAHQAQREFPRLPEGDGTRVEAGELVVFKRIVNEREILGTVYMRAEYALFDRLLGYLGIAAVVTALAMGVAWFFSRWVHRVLVRPVPDRRIRAGMPMADRESGKRIDVRGDPIGAVEDFDGVQARFVSVYARTRVDLDAGGADGRGEKCHCR